MRAFSLFPVLTLLSYLLLQFGCVWTHHHLPPPPQAFMHWGGKRSPSCFVCFIIYFASSFSLFCCLILAFRLPLALSPFLLTFQFSTTATAAFTQQFYFHTPQLFISVSFIHLSRSLSISFPLVVFIHLPFYDKLREQTFSKNTADSPSCTQIGIQY